MHIHDTYCTGEPSPFQRTAPVPIKATVRALCRLEQHTDCSAVTLPTLAAPYAIVCSCSCHYRTGGE